MSGSLVISLDMELYWGLMDKKPPPSYMSSIEGVRLAVPKILDIFKSYNISATWACVGMTLEKEAADILSTPVSERPHYLQQNYSNYVLCDKFASYIDCNKNLFFASDLIRLIAQTPGQEIGSHSYSHLYFLEEGLTLDDMRSDFLRMEAICQQNNIAKLKSFVFPRNQFSSKALRFLKEFEFKTYRGNQHGKIYYPTEDKISIQGYVIKALRILNEYINISGDDLTDPNDLIISLYYDGVCNIPASRFLRPYSEKLKSIEELRFLRIANSLRKAAINNKIYHLWWHPHNFGTNIGENIIFLERILMQFKDLNISYGMKSYNMQTLVDEYIKHV